MDSFWGMPAGTDLAMPAEVKVSVDGTSVAEKITLVSSSCGGYRVKAAKKFKKGDLILAEMALCFVEGPVAGKVDPLDVLRRTRFVGPFSSTAGRPAAIRVAAQLPVWQRAAAKDAAGIKACTRAQLLATALSAHGFRCSAPSKWLKGDKAGDEGPLATRSGAGASAVPVTAEAAGGERPAELGGDDEHDKDGHCLFLRGSLFRHSCEPTAAVQVRFDRVTGAPALYVIARGELAAGAEVTISYLPDTSAPLSRRQHLLEERYGFACACARCSLPYDDTIALRCASCPGPVRVRSAASVDKATSASPASDAAAAERSACSAAVSAVDGEEEAAAAAARALKLICAQCGADCDSELLAQRASALHALDTAVAAAGGVAAGGSVAGPEAAARHVDTALAAFKAVHHAADTHFLVRAHLLLHRLVQPTRMLARKAPAGAAAASTAAASTSPAAASPAGGSPAAAASPVPESAVELSALVLAAASGLPYLDPYLLLDVAVDHGLLCGMAGCGERGAEAWRLAAQLATDYNPLGTALHELFESFGRKPPRTALEAATAARMRRVAEDALGL
jgi:hypothetical protein